MKGTIRERVNKDGTTSYVCQVKVGRDPATSRQRVATGTARSSRGAHRLLHDLITKSAEPKTQASDTTLNDVIEQWLLTGGPPGEATSEVYAGYLKLHIAPTIGTSTLRNLRVVDVERWYASLRDKGLGPASIRKAHNIVRAGLAQAVLVFRRELDVEVMQLSAAQAQFVDQLAHGAGLGAAAVEATRHDQGFDLGTFLASLIRLQLITGIHHGDHDHEH